jgi:aspartate carbamoyltransferase catalytic subunit
MALRVQQERMTGGRIGSLGEYASLYQLNDSTLRLAKPDCIVMHPGPMNRGVEIDDATADGPQSVIEQQVLNSVFARMASFCYGFGVQI